MNTRLACCLFAFVLGGSLSASPCCAQVGEKYALLVGVREYDKNELRTLPFSEADVEGMARLLRDSGYRPENVVVMTQSIGSKKPRFSPVAANIRKELELLLEGRSEGDSIVIALAGHGVQFRDDDECYFCPTDAKLGEKESLIPLGQIYKTLEGCKANLKLLLVDACRNDPQADNSRARVQVKLESVTRPQAKEPPGGVAALFSCSAGERAFEHPELKRGVFFHFVIQGLGGEADFDRDKTVTLPELQQYTMKRVPDFVRAEYGVVQTPDLRGKTRGLFPLLKIDPSAAGSAAQSKLRLTGQSVASRQIVQKFVELVEKHHSSGLKFDDNVAVRAMDDLLQSFDPQKRIFLQSDVDQFRARAREIDDKARLGDLGIVWEVFHTWVERRVERRKWADELFETEHDFSIPEEFAAAAPAWPRTRDEAKDDWRKRVKYYILTYRAKGYDLAEATHQASRLMSSQFFGSLRSFDDNGMLETGLNALGNAFDPQTMYYSPTSVANFEISTRARLVGIGAELQGTERGALVKRVVSGGPAARDGRLKADDQIVGVGEKDGPIQPLTDFKLNDSVELIRGKEGTLVRLEVLPSGKSQTVIYELTRGNVDLQVARGTTFTESRRGDARPVKIGFITLPSLYSNYTVATVNRNAPAMRTSADDTEKILTDFNRENVDVVILDLRSNGGGPLKEVFAMLGLFLDPGPCVQSRDQSGKIDSYWSDGSRQVWDRPLILLTSRITGPGPEIIAGALQDYRRAIVVGDERTSGNSSSQSVFDIGESLVTGNNPPKLGAVKITTAVLNLPSGRSFAGRGIAPDILLPSFQGVTYPDNRQFFWKDEPVPPVVFPPTQFVTSGVIDRVKKLAAERQAVTPDFIEFQEQVQKYREQKNRTTWPLDEARFLALSQSEIHPPLDDPYGTTVATRDPYINEVLAIAVDFAPRGRWNEHFNAGMTALRNKDHAGAVTHFTAAIQEDANQPAAYVYRARAHAGQGNWDKALADATSAGSDAVSSYLTAAAEVKVGDKVVSQLTVGQRVVVQKINGDWLWVQPVEKPKVEGWVKKSSVIPTPPEGLKKK